MRSLDLDIEKLRGWRDEEVARFRARIPRSRALYEQSRRLMPNGVPCSWMAAFYPGTEIFVDRGAGAHFSDVDGNRYLDMTQSDLSMVCGFGPPAVARAVADRFAAGSHFLLPTEDAIAVARLLAERFGLPFWQFTLSASAANTEAFRIARLATGRDKVLIFAGKYHGHIDETLVEDNTDGSRARPSRPAARDRAAHHRRAFQRSRRGRSGAAPGRRRLCPGRAGDDQYRRHPSR